MGMVVQHNLTSMNANRNLGVSCGALSKSTEKLSSGYKINRAGDNAAGLAISEKMRGQIRGLNQASANSEDGISMIQTAEGALTETHSILQRMRELAVQAASDTNTDDDRTQIQNEIDQLTQEVDRIATTTEFNTKKLLDGSRTGSVTAKDGKTSIEGTFGNSNVSASITSDGSKTASFTDVIRIEITKDYSANQAVVKEGTIDLSNIQTDLGGAVATDNTAIQTLTNNIATDQYKVQTGTNTFENILATGKTAKNVEDAALAYAAALAKAGGVDTGAEVSAALGNLQACFSTSATTSATATDLGVTPAGLTWTPGTTTVKDVADAVFAEVKAAATTKASDIMAVAEKNNVSADLVNTVDDLNSKKAAVTAAITAATTNTSVAQADIEGAVNSYINAIVDAEGSTTGSAVESAAKKLSALFNTTDSTATSVAAGTVIGSLTTTATTTKGQVNQATLDVLKSLAQAQGKAQANVDKETTSNMSIQDLFGNGLDASICAVGQQVGADGKLAISLKNDDGTSSVVTIDNADKLKAGDVLTITVGAAVESKQAAAGKEAFRLQVGANAGQEVSLGINSMKAKDLDIVQTKAGKEGQALDVTNQATASLAVNAYDMAIQKVSTERAKMGAMQNRLEHTIANLDTSAENLQSAESSLRDTDMAEEMTNYSKNNILMQAGQSMLAQANQSNQGVLSLLQ